MITAELKQQAKNAMENQIGVLIFAWIALIFINSIAAGISSGILNIVLLPLDVGLVSIHLLVAANKNANFDNLFDGFRYNFGENLFTIFIKNIFLFLWFMLFIIPGFIKLYSYYLVPFLLADDDVKETSFECITRSRELMDGHKLDLFLLHLSFILWILFGIITLGLGFIYVIPYMKQADTQFYLKVKHERLGFEKELIMDRNLTQDNASSFERYN
ncbi:MAG: DUF975 family protein [Candidatus Izimaplasma sp.]|nr:DUF975 family protein [Candidatus Izimaplasma bacterium]